MTRFCIIILLYVGVCWADTEQTCGDGEVLDDCPVDCPSDYCPATRCDDQSACPKPADKEDCAPPACKCRFNFKRAENGTCIRASDCPPFECDDNEEYNSCPSPFCSDDCSRATKDGKCHIIGRIGIVIQCKPACKCKMNYWRKNGVCVPYAECGKEPEKTCGPNEVLDNCPVDCPSDYCPTSECDDQSACPKPSTCPPPACKCAFNYRRATNGTCIPTRECPPFDCDYENEEYNPCPPLCSDTCSSATEDGKCRTIGRIGIVLPCKPTCRCKENFWRKKGDCVPYAQCKK